MKQTIIFVFVTCIVASIAYAGCTYGGAYDGTYGCFDLVVPDNNPGGPGPGSSCTQKNGACSSDSSCCSGLVCSESKCTDPTESNDKENTKSESVQTESGLVSIANKLIPKTNLPVSNVTIFAGMLIIVGLLVLLLVIGIIFMVVKNN